MGFWVLLLVNIGLFILGDLIRPKPKLENARPLGLGDFNFPTATEGRVVPIIWGKVYLKGPNVVWYGGLMTGAITQGVRTGFFSSKTIVTGYEYFIGIQFGLCRGPGVKLHQVKVKERWVTGGGAAGGSAGGYGINQPDLFGGPDFGGGLINSSAKFYSGELSQATNSYLTSKTGKAIRYNGIAYFTFEGGYIGKSANIDPWAFELSRRPDGLGLASYSPGSEAVNTYDCNPMNVIYEIMTDNVWGLGVSSTQIDVDNFREVAVVLATEGNGFSMILDSEKEATDVINEVMRQVDGVMYFERTTGKWKVALARDDYVVGSLLSLDEDSIIELSDFTRITWQETTNQVRIKFIDRDSEYKETYAMAQDMANMQLQGGVTSVELDFPGVKNATLANKIAWRELAMMSYPIAKINIRVNRKAFSLTPGATFKFSWARLGITDVVFRVADIDYGSLAEGEISIYAIQDIFSAGTGVFADPPGTGWVVPATEAVAPSSANTLAFEAPGQLVAANPDDPITNPRIWAGARDPGGGTIGFRLYTKYGASRPLSGGFNEDSPIYAFLLAGSLETAIDEYGTTAVRPDTSYGIRINDSDPDSLESLAGLGNATSVSSLLRIIYIEGEFIGFENMADVGGGVYQLTSIYRGLFNSAPAKHAANARVWFVGQTGGNLSGGAPSTGYDEADIQLRSIDKYGTMAEGDSNTISLPTLTNTWSEPLPPRDPKLNGSYAPETGSIDTDYSAETGFSGDNGKGISVEVSPRCWRINDILNDHILSASPVPYEDDNPEFDFSLILDPAGTPLETAVFTDTIVPTTAKVYITRNAVIIAAGANNPISADGRIRVVARHTPDGLSVQSAVNDMTFDFTVTTALQGHDDLVFGGLTKDVASTTLTSPVTGTYDFNIQTALPSSGIVQYSYNGGAWATLIAAGATTGSIILGSGDTISIKFNQFPTIDRYFEVTKSGSVVGYGVLRSS